MAEEAQEDSLVQIYDDDGQPPRQQEDEAEIGDQSIEPHDDNENPSFPEPARQSRSQNREVLKEQAPPSPPHTASHSPSPARGRPKALQRHNNHTGALSDTSSVVSSPRYRSTTVPVQTGHYAAPTFASIQRTLKEEERRKAEAGGGRPPFRMG